jgi:chitinase
MVCYYGSWARYRPGIGAFDIDQIDPFLCTHLIFGFVELNNVTWEIAPHDPWNELCPDEEGGNYCAFVRFNQLRDQNPDLKTLLAIGGWNEGSEKYSDMAADPNKRASFIRSVPPFLRKYGFQGLDMDWEYPTYRGGDDEDKENYGRLLHELSAALKAEGYLLTTAVNPDHFKMDNAYDVQAMIETLDIINVMAYDFFGAWETFIHHNSPMFTHPINTGNYTYFDIYSAMTYWVDLMGDNSHKLTMGMPLYSRGFTPDDPSNTTIGASATPGQMGPYTLQDGVLGFNELCEIRIAQGGAFEMVWDDIIQAKFVKFNNETLGLQYFSYDDMEALDEKLKLIRDLPIGGGMVWSIDTDDFQNVCGFGRNPLLNHIVKNIFDGGITPDPTKTTTAKPSDGNCDHEGLIPSGEPCSPEFIICTSDGNGGWIGTDSTCSPGTIFNPDLGICDFPENVDECRKKLKNKHHAKKHSKKHH